ncbi:hypothetical protein [Bacillus sp. EB01]|uniref:hypothetical protein n=1 Tax=Bacillus sp. EB01 TaxID=1347086 RepID=UPI0005C66B1F|nr:hypothetical protein [Bacillus sp. EB01]
MNSAIYVGLLIFALICSLVHVFIQIKADKRPGEIVLQSFFIAFFILGSSCLWWIIIIDNDITQSIGVLLNGIVLGLITFNNMHLSFYLDEHRELFETNMKHQPENPRYI